MMKKFLSSTLTLCMMLSLLPAAAFAQETQMDSGVPAKACICENKCIEENVKSECLVCSESYAACTMQAPPEAEDGGQQAASDTQTSETQESVCSCERKCSDESVNSACAVCAEGYAACTAQSSSEAEGGGQQAASDPQTPETQEPVCSCERKCSAENINSDCEICKDSFDQCEFIGEIPAEETSYEKAVRLFQALPSADSIAVDMTDEEKDKILSLGQAAMDAYENLTSAEQELFDTEHGNLLLAAMALNDVLTDRTAETLEAGSVTLYVNSAAQDDSAARTEGAEYKTLGGAIDKAVSGDAIVFRSDSAASSVFIETNLTIDFNGYVLTLSSSSYGIDVSGTANLTLKDSSGDNSGGATHTRTSTECILVEDSANVTIEGGSYTSQYGYCVEAVGTGQVVINGGSFAAVTSCVYNDSRSARIFLNNGTFSGNINGASGGVLLTPEVFDQVYTRNRLYNNIYIHFPSGQHKLQKDLDLRDWQLRILEGEDTTIDLNGFNITGKGMMEAPTEGGTVSTGGVQNLACLIQIHESGKLTLENTGACNASRGRIYNTNDKLRYTIKNYGELVLNGNLRIEAELNALVTTPYVFSGAIYMESDFGAADPQVTLTVNEGVEITAKKAGTANSEYPCAILSYSSQRVDTGDQDKIDITINGGSFCGDYCAMQLCGKLTINGGTFANSQDSAAEVFYIGSPDANLTGISNASFVGKNKGMYIGKTAFHGNIVTLHNTTISNIGGAPVAHAVAQQGEGKNVVVTGKDTFWVADELTFTNNYCKGTIQIQSGIFSVDPADYVPDSNSDSIKDYAVLDYSNDTVSQYFLVAPWTRVGADNVVSLYYAAGATAASDHVSILALDDIESIISDSTRVQSRHFTLSAYEDGFTEIPGLSVTGFQNGNRLTVQKTKDCAASEAYVWYGGRSIGKIIIEDKNKPAFDVGGEITGAGEKPTAYLIRDGVKYYAVVTGEADPYEYIVKNVPAGIYNLVVSSKSGEHAITTTVMVDIVDHSIAQNVRLPGGIYNSVVTTKGEKTPNVEAGGLDDIAKTIGAPSANTHVLIELKVEENESSTHAREVKTAISDDGMVKGIVMDTDIFKTINNGQEEKITVIDESKHGVSLITVVFHLPEDLRGKDSYAIFRYHGTQVDKIMEVPNENGEYMTVNPEKDTITAYLSKFSTYSIAYTQKYTVIFNANGGSVTVSSAETNAAHKLDILPTPTRSGSYRFDGWYTEAKGGTEVTANTVFVSDSTIYAHWTYTGGSGGGSGSGSGGGSYHYYTITATAGTGGSISAGKYVSVREGDSAGFTITPDKGYVIADIKVDGKSVGAISKYTFTNVRANHTIEATFKASASHSNPQTGVELNVTDHFAATTQGHLTQITTRPVTRTS
ncbi:MAG: InlB B-repeat-containing protein [Agathobaculum sp.]|jgi:hypothetical protein|uniref:InlB B-repeat-containing protein n=1 Tax=Agathobaculum sp. TaxID=2048138 RepID=UPI003D8FF6AE